MFQAFGTPVDLYIKQGWWFQIQVSIILQHLSQKYSSESIYGDISVLYELEVHVYDHRLTQKHFFPALRYDDRPQRQISAGGGLYTWTRRAIAFATIA